MERIDNKNIPNDPSEVRLFSVGKQEASKIPYFIEYHKNLGVDRIFYVDNNSDDNSIEILKQYDNVHIWKQTTMFNIPLLIKWQMELLKKYGIGNWCLLLDVDELFVFPNSENKSIKQFVKEQESQGYDCILSLFIDMYSDKNLNDVHIINSLQETLPYFDKVYPGCRGRVLNMGLWLEKHNLFKCHENTKVHTGNHWLYNFKKRSNIYCAMLHYKWISTFYNYIDKSNGLGDIKEYKKITKEKNINFYDKNISIKYEGTKQLAELGLMSNEEGTNILQKELLIQGKRVDDAYNWPDGL